MANERELQELGAWVHGALTALHALGVVYNVRRRNWRDVVAHTCWLIYDGSAARRHWRDRLGSD